MTPDQKEKCHVIIHTASGSAAAVGGGMAQIPLADHLVITPIQITMVVALGKVCSRASKSSSQPLEDDVSRPTDYPSP